MADLFWCEAHNSRMVDRTEPHPICQEVVFTAGRTDRCSVVRLVESRDSEGRLLGLLVTEECEDCEGTGIGTHAGLACGRCGGSGQRYRAGWPGSLPPVAVLPLPETP